MKHAEAIAAYGLRSISGLIISSSSSSSSSFILTYGKIAIHDVEPVDE